MSDQSDFGSGGFADPTRAIRMRDAIRKIAEQEVGKLTANQQVARVISVNFSNMTADVWIPGDPDPIKVNMFDNLIPGATTSQGFDNNSAIETSTTGTGSLCVIDMVGGKLYITRILSGGQFASRLGAAGFVHKSMNGLITGDGPELWKQSAVVSGNYGLSLSLFAPSNGDSCMIGPFVGFGNGGFYPGTIRVYVTRLEDTATYEAVIDQTQIARLTGSTGPTKWMRMIPQRYGSNWRLQAMHVDIGVRSTSYRDKGSTNEIWLRVNDDLGSADFSYVHIEAFGPLITFGDVDLGRIRIEDASFDPHDGYLGFHDSFFLFRGRDNEVGKTGPMIMTTASGLAPSYHSGSWLSGPRTMTSQLARTWSCEGAMTWSGTHVTWDDNILFGGIGAGWDTLPHGLLQVPVPANGTVIPVVPAEYSVNPSGTPTSATATANGIPLSAGHTLYYGIPPGMLNSGSITVANDGSITASSFTNWHTKEWMFFIVNDEVNVGYAPTFAVPEWAIPICGRKSTASLEEFQVYSQNVQVYDMTKSANVSSTSTQSSLAANTETVTLTFPSFTFKAGAAYRVRAKSGYSIAASANNNGMPHFRLRKGTTISGNDWGEFFRQDSPSQLGQVEGFEGELVLANSGAAFTSQFVMTVNFVISGTVPSPTPTLTIFATSQSKRYLELEFIGPAAKYAHAVAIS